MSFSEKRDSHDPTDAITAPGLPFVPSDAVIEAWLGAKSNGPDLPFDGLMTLYRAGELSAVQRRRVEERLETDPEFRARAELLTTIWSIPPQEDLTEVEHTMAHFLARLELEKQGINVPSLYPRRRYPRRNSRRGLPAAPIDPADFMTRLVAQWGTDAAKVLVMQALGTVENTGNPDCWIAEVARARKLGVISPAVAQFLIWQLAEAAIMHWAMQSADVALLTAKLERIEQRHSAAKAKYWHVRGGPAEWSKLYNLWEAAYNLELRNILLRNGERAIAESLVSEDMLHVGWKTTIDFEGR
jgi:hypothetical protein